MELLSKTAVTDMPSKPVVVLSAEESPVDAYVKLADENIRSAPVYNNAEKKFIGFLDVRDLVQMIVYENQQGDLKKSAATHSPLSRVKFMDRLVKVGARMYDAGGDSLSLPYLARRHPFHSLDEAATLADVAKLLVTTRCHRVPIVNAKGDVVNVISQSSLIKHLNAHMDSISVADRTVEEMGGGTKPVLSVSMSDTILSAFELMASKDIMGVAIVDEGGHLVANTSASDFKEFVRDPTTSLHLTAIDFISKVRQHDLKAVHPAISVTPQTTVRHLIGKLAATRVHRVFEVDEEKRLRSVLSLTDTLKYMLAQ